MSPLTPVTIRVRRGLLILAILAMPALPAAAWVVSSSLSKTEDRTVEIARLTREIQAQRAESIERGCREQNERYDRTIEALDTLIGQAPPSRRERARRGRAGTILLIQALAPRRDCAALVRRSTSTP